MPRNTFFQRAYIRFIKIRGEPRKIALGFAMGLFIGMTPSMGFQTAIVIFIAALLKWNKISAAIGVWITNPLTAPFIYSTTYFIGAKILDIKNGYNPSVELNLTVLEKLLQKAPQVIWALIIGGIILGLPLALVGYYFSYSTVQKYQDDIKRRIAKRKEGRALKRQKRAKRIRGETGIPAQH